MAILTGRRDGGRVGRGENPFRPDLSLVGAVVALSGLGLLMIYSATRAALLRRELLPSASTERQLVFVLIGLAAMIALSYVDYRDYRFWAPVLYVVCLGGLGVAFLFDPINGVRRWISLGPVNVQPAEFTKLVLVMVLASLFSGHPDETSGELPWKKLLYALGLSLLPMSMIFLQPDLGTMMSYPAILLLMLFVAGATRGPIGDSAAGGGRRGGGGLAAGISGGTSDRSAPGFCRSRSGSARSGLEYQTGPAGDLLGSVHRSRIVLGRHHQPGSGP